MKQIITDITKLKVACSPVEFITSTGMDKTECNEIIAAIKEVLEADKTLLYIAAPQIGIQKRIFCIRFNDTIKTFINPVITKKEGNAINIETCISLPGKEILITRPNEITTVYYTDEFKYEDNKFIGPAAKIFDQAAQLLDGITPDDLGLVSDIEQDGSLTTLSDEEMKEVIEFYKQYVATKQASMEKAINNDEDIKKQYNSLKFTESVINGKAAVVDQGQKMNRAQRRALQFNKNNMLKKGRK